MDSGTRARATRAARRAAPGWLREHPDLIAQWHPTANGDLDPLALRAASGRRVWWRCAAGHEWQALISNRSRKGSRCPTCTGRRPDTSTILETTHPEVAATWHPTANGDLTPAAVKAGSGRSAWWRCDAGHEWQTRIYNRCRTRGCPFCAGRQAAPEAALTATHPDLAQQWHPTANGDLTPNQIRAGSSRRVHWLCPTCGHSYAATPARRTRTNSGCRVCAYATAGARRATQPLTETHPEIAAQWHPTRNHLAHPAHITYGSGRPVWWLCERGHAWQISPHSRCSSRTGCPYCSHLRATPTNNLAVVRPDVAARWHPTRNGDRTPEQVGPWSNLTAWWRCPTCAHEWEGTPGSQPADCVSCTGHTVTATNNLATVAPDLTAEWHPTANGDRTTATTAAFSNAPAWWRCTTCGHEWSALIRNRTYGAGCPAGTHGARGH